MHEIDTSTSRNFLNNFISKMGKERVLDCGAGIGRVTKHVLLDYFEKVDLVEPSPIQLEQAKPFINSDKV